METNEAADDPGTPSTPTPAEAAAALHDAERARASIAEPRTPLWYFLALAALVAPLGFLVKLVPPPPLGIVILVVGVLVWGAALGAIMSLVVRQMRVLAWLSPRQLRPFLWIGLAIIAVSLLLNAVLEIPWADEAFTVVVAIVIAAFGVHHQVSGGRR